MPETKIPTFTTEALGKFFPSAIGLPNTCAVTRELVTEGEWYVRSIESAQGGEGYSKAGFEMLLAAAGAETGEGEDGTLTTTAAPVKERRVISEAMDALSAPESEPVTPAAAPAAATQPAAASTRAAKSTPQPVAETTAAPANNASSNNT